MRLISFLVVFFLNFYGNIFSFAKECNYKKIMVKRTTWGFGSWCIVSEIHLKLSGYGSAFGFCQFRDGSKYYGKIDNAGTFSWCLLRVLDDDMKVVYPRSDSGLPK